MCGRMTILPGVAPPLKVRADEEGRASEGVPTSVRSLRMVPTAKDRAKSPDPAGDGTVGSSKGDLAQTLETHRAILSGPFDAHVGISPLRNVGHPPVLFLPAPAKNVPERGWGTGGYCCG